MRSRIEGRRRARTSGLLLGRIAVTIGLAASGACVPQTTSPAPDPCADLHAELDKARDALRAAEAALADERIRSEQLVGALAAANGATEASAASERQLRLALETARKERDQAIVSIETQRQELQKALDEQRQTRTRWEQEIADRNRRIDVLNSRIRQLEKEIESLRGASATKPAPSP